ncbi:MAG: FkbM family methyltransferase [Nitrospirota bacterium]
MIRRSLRRAGFDLVKYDHASHPLARRARLLTAYNIDLVLDVGANTGQYGRELRAIGYRGRIVSFEPLRAAYDELARAAKADGAWTAVHAAVGDRDGTAELNIAGNSQSSSLLEMLPLHLRSAPESRYCGTESVPIVRLDTVFRDYWTGGPVCLKIDTQGFERRVIEGAERSLAAIDTLQLELSLAPLYKDETLFSDMSVLLARRGYALVSLEQGFSDPTDGRLLQVDGIFHRLGAAGGGG